MVKCTCIISLINSVILYLIMFFPFLWCLLSLVANCSFSLHYLFTNAINELLPINGKDPQKTCPIRGALRASTIGGRDRFIEMTIQHKTDPFCKLMNHYDKNYYWKCYYYLSPIYYNYSSMKRIKIIIVIFFKGETIQNEVHAL